MIIVDDKNKSASSPRTQLELSSYSAAASSHQSNETERLLVDVAPNPPATPLVPNEPPPSFTLYTAEFFLDNRDDVVSHDHHLNTDGEALYRFLLSQSGVLPTLRILFRGTHRETRQRWVDSTDAHGRTSTRSEYYTDTVTDFDFCIDIRPDHLKMLGADRNQGDAGYTPVHWSVGDDEPAYRGRLVREYEVNSSSSPIGSSHRRKLNRKEISRYLGWMRKRQQMGYPPWVREEEEGLFVDGSVQSMEENVSLRSSKTLRQWADEYCASPKLLKEFVYQKVLYGWNFSHLEKSLHSLVLSAPYNGNLEISFTNHSSKIYIRPSNRLSRMLSNKWLKFLSIILLIYPFIWLFKKFHKKGGGIWEVCGGAYPLKQWVPVGREEVIPLGLQYVQQEETLPPYYPEGASSSNPILSPTRSSGFSNNLSSHRRSARYMQTASGVKKMMGIREGEWFRNWEGLITRAVIGRYQSSEPLGSGAIMSGHELDGYYNDSILIPV